MSKRTETTRPSGTEAQEGDAFLSRWARRKRVARSGGDPDSDEARAATNENARPAEAAPIAGDAPDEADAEEPRELTDADMPAVDSIDESTDMSGFFSPKVSETLKRAALRKFFHSQAFNIVDGLDDYDDDFRSFEALGDIITSDMRGRMEREAERAKESSSEEAEGAQPASAEASPEPATDDADMAETQFVEPDAAPATCDADASATPGITRDPARLARSGPAKLRPRKNDDGDAHEDAVGEGEDA